MRSIRQKVTALAVLLGAPLLITGSVAAHVVVRPAEVLTASFQTFTLGMPNERDVPATGVKVLIPDGLQFVSPTVKPGWEISVEHDSPTGAEGHKGTAKVKSISWRGGSVGAGLRDDFTFSAKVPAEPVELQWKAYQTYGDGQAVAWELTQDQQPKKEDGSPDFSKLGPFSVTKVLKETEQQAATKNAEEAATNARDGARRAQQMGFVAFVIGLVALATSTRSTKK